MALVKARVAAAAPHTITLRAVAWACADAGACVQGIYVLQDNNFRWLLRLAPASSLPDGSSRAEYMVAQPYLELPCGLIRGAASAGQHAGPAEHMSHAVRWDISATCMQWCVPWKGTAHRPAAQGAGTTLSIRAGSAHSTHLPTLCFECSMLLTLRLGTAGWLLWCLQVP